MKELFETARKRGLFIPFLLTLGLLTMVLVGTMQLPDATAFAEATATPATPHASSAATPLRTTSTEGVAVDWSRLDSLQKREVADSAHVAAFLEERFPSANTCATCHPDHYREWSVSQHAYAQMSPIFNAMHGKILKLTNGTNGDFCIRCHTPVGMNLEEPEFMSNMDRHPTSREGITCIVCHRLENAYSKVSGRLAIVEGDLSMAVFGPQGNKGVEDCLGSSDCNVVNDPTRSGRLIHGEARQLGQISTSAFCGTCHDVNLVNGFRLEEAFSEYKSTDAARNGVSCQDCHMGKEPGLNAGYDIAPAAKVGAHYTEPRKRTNHMFAGPDYSVIHPGIFPHNVRATEKAEIRDWLVFNVDAGWGTDEFEDNVPDGYEFPEVWKYADDRYDAREIIGDNLELLAEIRRQQMQILRVGYVLGDVAVDKAGSGGIDFRIQVSNGTDGHNVPTGFDAERLVFLQVTVTDANGQEVFLSGDRDPNGDVRDLHSIYVHNGEIKQDKYLFSLQSRFLTRMVRGGEREQVLALNYSPDPLPFLRPSTRSTVLLARPVGARKHRQTIPPLTSKWPEYNVSRRDLRGTAGPYNINVKLIAQMVPVNLIHEIQDVGFDYFMSPREIADAVVGGAQVLWERDVPVEL